MPIEIENVIKELQEFNKADQNYMDMMGDIEDRFNLLLKELNKLYEKYDQLENKLLEDSTIGINTTQERKRCGEFALAILTLIKKYDGRT